MPILSLTIWILVIVAWAYTDAKRNDKGKGILMGHHLAAWIGRYFVAFFLVLYVCYMGQVPYPEGIYTLINYGAWAWVIFDPVYSLTRKLGVDYVGTTSWLDKIFHKFPDAFAAQMIVKSIYLVGSVILVLL